MKFLILFKTCYHRWFGLDGIRGQQCRGSVGVVLSHLSLLIFLSLPGMCLVLLGLGPHEEFSIEEMLVLIKPCVEF